MEFQDQLPCGGYEQEDKKIEKNLQKLSLETEGKQTKQEQKCEKQCENCQCEKQEKKVEQMNPCKKDIKCKKCKQNQAVLSHKNQFICKQCLMKNIEYKTRLTLQNKVKVKGKSKILLCFSGGLNSICLVNIFKNIKKRYQKNPLFGELECIHIKQQAQLPENYHNKFEQITGLPLQIIPIQKVYQDKEYTFELVRELFKKLPKGSNSVDLLQIFKDKLILQYAQEHTFDFVMLGKNGESLAGQMFKYFTKGVGGSAGQLCSNEKGPYDYPLRQHLQKQLQYYFYAEKLGCLSMLAREDDLSHCASNQIDSILNNFITSLQDRYSHTAPAIVRTGERLKRKNIEKINKCRWCFLDHNQDSLLCNKCFRFGESIKDDKIKKEFPKWMQI